MQFNLTPKQHEFLQALVSLKYRYLLFGGGMGSGKSYLIAFIIISMAVDYAQTRYGIFRKNLTTLRRTSFQTFKKVASALNINVSYNMQEMTATFPNGSVVYFIEADITKDPDSDKLKGLELTAGAIDEANEVAEQIFNILMARIGRENNAIKGIRTEVPQFILLTCNPAQNWVKEKFYEPSRNGILRPPFYFLQALAKDNPFLSKEYIDALEYLPRNEYERYVLGNWDYSDDPQQLVKYEWLTPLLVPESSSATHFGVDVARYGDDRTIIAWRDNNTLTKLETFRKQSTVQTADILSLRMKDQGVGFTNVSVDVVGLGGGTVDTLHAKGLMVREYNSAEKSEESWSSLLFKNKRAESYFKLRTLIEQGTIQVVNDPELVKELTNVRYIVKDKTIVIEAKDELKKRLGYSPDKADAMAIVFSLGSDSGEVSTGQSLFNRVGYNFDKLPKKYGNSW